MFNADLIDCTAKKFVKCLDELFEEPECNKSKNIILKSFKETLKKFIKVGFTPTKSPNKSVKKRGPTGYNLYMKKRMTSLKTEMKENLDNTKPSEKWDLL
jgi:hypothetical protein